MPNCWCRRCVSSLMVAPLRPMTMPGRSATMLTRVPRGVRWMSRPPYPARCVSCCTKSLTRRRLTASFTNLRSTAMLLLPLGGLVRLLRLGLGLLGLGLLVVPVLLGEALVLGLVGLAGLGRLGLLLRLGRGGLLGLLLALGLREDDLEVRQAVVVRRGAALRTGRVGLDDRALVGRRVGDDEAVLVEALVLGVGLGGLQHLEHALGRLDGVASRAHAALAVV